MSLEIYPLYGYNAEGHICQLKQESANEDRNEALTGDYWSIGECRSSHPEMLFFTGQGILWWLVLGTACIGKYLFIAKQKKISFQSLHGSCALEMVAGLLLLATFLLLLNYFSVGGGSSAIPATSDIDTIISEYIFRPHFPRMLAGIYAVITFLHIFFLKRKK